jgi:hypothetical protein
MTESILPGIGEWWRSRGQRQGDAVSLPPEASTTPYDLSAVPTASRRFTIEITYSADRASKVDLRVNWFSHVQKKLGGPFNLSSLALDAAQGKTVTAEVALPANPSPRWLPSLSVSADSGEVSISSLKVYETPSPSGPSVTVWDGTREVPATIEFVN